MASPRPGPGASPRQQLLGGFRERLVQKYGPAAAPIADQEVARLLARRDLCPVDLTRAEEVVSAAARGLREKRSSRAASASPRSGLGGLYPERSPSIASAASSVLSARPQLLAAKVKARAADEWDLLQKYDHAKYEEEEQARADQKVLKQQQYRRELDAQLAEVLGRRSGADEEVAQDRAYLQVEAEKTRRDEQEAKRLRQEKTQNVLRGCDEALAMRRKKQLREDRILAQEKKDMLAQAERAEQLEQEKDKARKRHLRQRAEEIARHVKESVKLKELKVVQEQEEERVMMERYAESLAKRDAERKEGVEALRDRMKRIASTVGKALGQREEEIAKQDEERMVAAMREQEEAACAKDRRKQELKQQRLAEMKVVLDSQVQQRKQRKQQNQLDWVLQGKIWKEEAVVAREEEARKLEAQRQKRRNLDLALKVQVAGTLDEEQRLLPHLQRHARTVNQAAFRHMAADGFAGAEEFLMAKS